MRYWLLLTAGAVGIVSLSALARTSDPGTAAAFDPADRLGIYVLGAQRRSQAWRAAVVNPAVRGASISAEWDRLQPSPDQFEWDSLADQLAATESAGKWVGLRLFPGVNSPEWVYKRGARCFAFVDRSPLHHAEGHPEGHRLGTFGRTLCVPVPWDDSFLTAWEAFVAAAGARFRAHSSIALVHVTGPTKHSAEMFLPRTPEDQDRWRKLGYTPDKLVGAWRRSIDVYARSFPGAAVVLDLSPAIFPDDAVERVAEYCFNRYGSRCFMQNNILRRTQPRGRIDWAILRDYAGRAIIGFQRDPLRLGGSGLDPSTRRRLRRENYEGVFQVGMELGAFYFEVGAQDIVDFPDITDWAAQALAERSRHLPAALAAQRSQP